ncbi:unnamed protein product [Adineta steineri]|uniref:Ribosomal protein L55 n=1 Tax=Adineta steineri TaxID=433720 RepID=A0A813NP85_9BILA|nr:unnamed protein product [Adineta steineri]CAF0742584.1 unnamed protein product [Adineta steineri]CAF0777364.1 unnamed protein product [Adineta steineri]CAF0809321.1 unnamed protein product [Adineta steineri]CAF0812246.1 unnamed protein product [Adineta steineri]
MLLKNVLPLVMISRSNCYRSSITRFSRDIYSRLYPNYLVLPDGSTIRIRYSEPRHLVKLPVDIASLSEKEQKTRLLRRTAAQKERVETTLDTAYDPSAYLNQYTK